MNNSGGVKCPELEAVYFASVNTKILNQPNRIFAEKKVFANKRKASCLRPFVKRKVSAISKG